jgi:hypothetical protein
LSYRYEVSVAHLFPLEAEHLPGHYDLCAAHAQGLKVPAGWDVVRAPGIEFDSPRIGMSDLEALAEQIRAIGLRDELTAPLRVQPDESSVVELARRGHLRVIADISRAS